MKERIRKAFCMTLAAMVAFCGIWSTDLKAKAAVKWGNPINTGYYWAESGEISIMKVNGNHAFCLEPDQYVSTTSGYKEQEPNFTDAQWERLIKIAHFGYNKEKKTNADYAATQIMIWRQLWMWRDIEPASIKDTNVPGLSQKINTIEKEIKEYDAMIKSRPSFASTGVQVVSGKSVTLTDTSGALSKYPYKVISARDDIQVSINKKGGSMKVTAGKGVSGKTEITLKLESDNLIGSNRFYYHKSSQDVGNIGYIEDTSFKIPIRVDDKGNMSLLKTSSSGKAVSGATFEIRSEDGSFVKEYTTGEDGRFLASGLVQGTYVIKEVSVPEPYLLDSTEKTVVITAGQTASVEFTNNMPSGEFTLEKTDKSGVPLAGAVFEIYSEGNDLEGNEIGFNGEFTTDENGLIVVKNLVPGTYFYREIQAPEGYLIDETIYSFEIGYEDNKTALIQQRESVSNDEPVGSITLQKSFAKDQEVTDEEKEAATLEGAVYGLYAADVITDKSENITYYDKDEKIGQFVTDENGFAEAITGLPMGKYYVKEINAPEGCVLDESIHEVKLSYVDQNTANIDVTVQVEDYIKEMPEEPVPDEPKPEPKEPKKTVKTADAFPAGALMALGAMGLLGTCFAAVRRKDR